MNFAPRQEAPLSTVAPALRAGDLEHFQYDTFVARWDDRTIEPAYVTFALDAKGGIERITMKPYSPLADFSYDYQDLLFTPQATDGGP